MGLTFYNDVKPKRPGRVFIAIERGIHRRHDRSALQLGRLDREHLAQPAKKRMRSSFGEERVGIIPGGSLQAFDVLALPSDAFDTKLGDLLGDFVQEIFSRASR
jgi:hypothetical protein